MKLSFYWEESGWFKGRDLISSWNDIFLIDLLEHLFQLARTDYHYITFSFRHIFQTIWSQCTIQFWINGINTSNKSHEIAFLFYQLIFRAYINRFILSSSFTGFHSVGMQKSRYWKLKHQSENKWSCLETDDFVWKS